MFLGYSVATILYLQFMLHVMLFTTLNILYFYIRTFQSMCTVPNMAGFCSFLISCFPGMLLGYFLNDSDIVQVVPINTGITCFFIRNVLYFYCKVSASFLITFLSPEIAHLLTSMFLFYYH
jgi:hypothetical protein